MIQGSCRIWNVSILAVILLSIYNIILTLKLMYVPECNRHSTFIKPLQKPTKCDPIPTFNRNEPLFNLDLRLGRWDTRLEYKLFDNILVGEKFSTLSNQHKTCLATQSSLEKISSLNEVSANWNGPISLATFAASDDELNTLLLYILFLRKCNAKIREQVTFHFAYPKDHRPKNLNVDLNKLEEMNCVNPTLVLQHLVRQYLKGTKWRTKLPYPQNHLRNLARKNCQSKYVFLTDVDIIPSKGMTEKLDIFLEQAKCGRLCAYVIPTYEIDERVRFPPNKTELVRLAYKGLARPFHHKVFIYNQFATNFTKWQSTVHEEVQEVHISHPVTNFEFLYEPFYVAPDTVPPHDERFVGYGYTRNSQVYEMFVAGYEFLVLSPIFTCHWGLQVKKTRPLWREHQNNLNRKQFDGFKREIFAKYNKDPLNMMARKN